jgi:hypothetical protein
MMSATAPQTRLAAIDAGRRAMELLSGKNAAVCSRDELIESIRRRVMAWTTWSPEPVALARTSPDQREMKKGGRI